MKKERKPGEDEWTDAEQLRYADSQILKKTPAEERIVSTLEADVSYWVHQYSISRERMKWLLQEVINNM